MIRKTFLTATALVVSTLAGMGWAPPAHGQRAQQILMCVDLQGVPWSAAVEIEERSGTGAWNQILYVVTVPSQRCAQVSRNMTQARFTIRSHANGAFRNACQLTAQADRNATVRVYGAIASPNCLLVQ